MPPRRGSAAGRKFLVPPYYSQRAMFASLSALFYYLCFKYSQTTGWMESCASVTKPLLCVGKNAYLALSSHSPNGISVNALCVDLLFSKHCELITSYITHSNQLNILENDLFKIYEETNVWKKGRSWKNGRYHNRTVYLQFCSEEHSDECIPSTMALLSMDTVVHLSKTFRFLDFPLTTPKLVAQH